MITRRTALGWYGGLLGTALARAQNPDISTAANRRITVPFQYAARLGSIIVRVRINGKRALLIFDTGSTHVVVRPALLGLDGSKLQRAKSGAGLIGDAIGEEVTIELGGNIFPRRRVSIMDLTDALAVYHEPVDGLLGLDFLLEFSQATINLKDRTLVFDR